MTDKTSGGQVQSSFHPSIGLAMDPAVGYSIEFMTAKQATLANGHRAKPRGAGAKRDPGSLGPKGLKTRQRLLDATAALLETQSPVSLTAAAITRWAEVSPPSFYVYFDDIGDIVYELALVANNDLDEVLQVLGLWREGLPLQQGARAFVQAFRVHWQHYRTILSIRNMEADRGDTRFLTMRQDAGTRIISELGELIHAGRESRKPVSRKEALARATVVFAAIERIAATELLYPPAKIDMPNRDELVEAEIAILVELIAPPL